MTKEQFVLKLQSIGAIKFGKFTLKSGKVSPFYIDLREITSYPDILEAVSGLLVEKIKHLKFDVITGIPYTALPMATLVSTRMQKPLVYMRKEEKAYGVGGSVIGKFQKNDICLVVDDLITTGESKIETAEAYEKEGVKIKDFVVVIDRSVDGQDILEKKGYQLHSLMTLDEIVKILRNHDLISEEKVKEIKDFTGSLKSISEVLVTSVVANSSTVKLKELIEHKKSNLILSLDVENQKDFFHILDQTAEHLVMVKTHVDVLDDFDNGFITKLKKYAEKYNFLIFEDRKFADIGNTVRKQYRGGIYKISQWSEFVTVHLLPGEGILTGLFDGLENRSSFLLARMSAKGNLINETYTRKVLEIGRNFQHCVSGYIGHGNSVQDIARFKEKIPAGQMLLMPGVQLEKGGDAMGQQYITVEDAMNGGADAIIIGRGIYGEKNPKEAAQIYREKAWNLFSTKK